MEGKARSRNGLEILRRRFVENNPEMQELIEQERADFNVGTLIHYLRTEAGLTQEQLAERASTTQSVISRLEDVEYEGHTLAMLNRVARAVGKTTYINFLGNEEERRLIHEFQITIRELREFGWEYTQIQEMVQKLGKNAY